MVVDELDDTVEERWSLVLLPSPIVVFRVFSRGIPRSPSARISRSTVQRATAMPSRWSSAWIFLAP